MPMLMFIHYTTLINVTSLNAWVYEMWEAKVDNKWSNKLNLQGRSVCRVGIDKRDRETKQVSKGCHVVIASKGVLSHLFLGTRLKAVIDFSVSVFYSLSWL